MRSSDCPFENCIERGTMKWYNKKRELDQLGVVLKKEHLEGCTMNDVFIANFCHNGVLSGADEAPNRKEAEWMGTKIMLLGIAIILAAIALSIDNIIAFGGGVLGLIVVIIGLFKSDNNEDKS